MHKLSNKRRSLPRVQKWLGFTEYMHNGMNNRSFTSLPKDKKIMIVKEAIKVVKHPKAKINMKADLKDLKSKSNKRNKSRQKH